MPGPVLRQTEEHRCSSRVVVWGSSRLRGQTTPAGVLLMDPWRTRSASSAAGCAALVHLMYIPSEGTCCPGVSHWGWKPLPWAAAGILSVQGTGGWEGGVSGPKKPNNE